MSDNEEQVIEQNIGDLDQVYYSLRDNMYRLKRIRGEDRSEQARHIAVVITELEKAVAYYKHFILDKYESRR